MFSEIKKLRKSLNVLPNEALVTLYQKIICAIENWKSPILFLFLHSNKQLNKEIKRSILYSNIHLNERERNQWERKILVKFIVMTKKK